MIEITDEQYALLHPPPPVQRGNLLIPNRAVINALIHVAGSRCTWRDLTEHFGNWHTVRTRLNRRADAGVLARLLAVLLKHGLVREPFNCLGLDGDGVRDHPAVTGAR